MSLNFIVPIRLSILAFIFIILSACSIQTKNVEPLPVSTHAFDDKNLLLVADHWWLAFDDTQLSELVTLGLKNNASLSANLARVKSAQEALHIAEANFNPDLKLSSSVSSDITELKKVNSASLGVNSTWDLDLWGRISALEEKAQWDLVARQALFKARANLVASNVVNYWYDWLAAKDKEKLFVGQHKRTNTALKVISRRFAMGKNSITDIWQQKRLLESIEGQQETNHARILTAEKQLALWLGISADDLPTLKAHDLPELSALTNNGISFDMIQQRPDIQQAFAELQASNASLAAAITEQYPRLSLKASYGTNKSNSADLFDDWAGNLIASLTMPLFDSGQTQAQIKQKELNYQAELLDFKQAWLNAIFSVERALITEQQLSKTTQILSTQRTLSEKTARFMSIKYLHGKTNYIALLRAQETNLNIERQLIDAQKSLINNRITLYRELSHGQFDATLQFSSVSIINNHE